MPQPPSGRPAGAGLILALLLGALLLFAVPPIWKQVRSQPVLPPFQLEQVAQVELSGPKTELVLVRQPDGGWTIPAHGNAPVDPDRMADFLVTIGKLTGTPGEAALPRQANQLRLQLKTKEGRLITGAEVATGYVRRLPDGSWLSAPGLPALPLWPSAWSSLTLPRFTVSDVLDGERVAGDSRQRLSPGELVRAATLLASLTPRDFMGSAWFSWDEASVIRLRLRDSSVLELQQLVDPAGGYRIRIASARFPALSGFAFHSRDPFS